MVVEDGVDVVEAVRVEDGGIVVVREVEVKTEVGILLLVEMREEREVAVLVEGREVELAVEVLVVDADVEVVRVRTTVEELLVVLEVVDEILVVVLTNATRVLENFDFLLRAAVARVAEEVALEVVEVRALVEALVVVVSVELISAFVVVDTSLGSTQTRLVFPVHVPKPVRKGEPRPGQREGEKSPDWHPVPQCATLVPQYPFALQHTPALQLGKEWVSRGFASGGWEDSPALVRQAAPVCYRVDFERTIRRKSPSRDARNAGGSTF